MSNRAEGDIIIFYIPNSIDHNFSCEYNVPDFLTSKQAFINRETNGNADTLTSRESNISTKDIDQDAKTLSSKENGFSIKN